MPTLGWDRAYRSGDVVRNDPLGLVFAGRADDQVKLGGRRIELGEIDEQLLRLPGVIQAAAAVRSTKSGNKLLVGYLTVDATYDADHRAGAAPRRDCPPRSSRAWPWSTSCPTRTSGKVDRDALPWPLPKSRGAGGRAERGPAVDRRDLGRRARRRGDLPEGRLLRLRRRLADRRPGGQPAARALPRGRRRRRLRPPDRRRARRRPGRLRQQPGRPGQPRGRARSAQDPGRPAGSPWSPCALSPGCAG